MEVKTLNNGVKMPLLGLGVFRIDDLKETQSTVENALSLGYRYIDTASAYGNEEGVGKAIKNSSVPRDQIFLTTKLWVPDISYEGAKKALDASLKRLGTDYVDLYVIHQPYNDTYGAWRAMEEMYHEGKIRALGVDHFSPARLVDFIEFNNLKPQVDYLETHPYYQRYSENDYLKSEDILQVGFSAFGSGKFNLFQNPVLMEIANKHNKGVGQVILRWLLQRGIAVIPKTTHINRLKENLDVFDFQLTDDEMKTIKSLDSGKSIAGNRQSPQELKKILHGFVHDGADES